MAALAGAGASVDAAVAIEEPCRATVGWGDSGGRAPSQEEFLERVVGRVGWRHGGLEEAEAAEGAEGSGDARAFIDAAAAIKEWRGAVLGWGDGGGRAPS